MKSKVKIKITGKNPDYFLNLLISKGVNIYNLSKNRKYIIIIVDYNDYLNILKIKTTYKIELVRVFGFIYIKDIIYNYYTFIISFILSLLLIILSSRFILKIDIKCSDNNLKDIIIDDLKERGISKYKFKVNYNDRESIIKSILLEEKDYIEWIEIEEVGCKYVVNVLPRIKNQSNDKCIPSNIIAKKDAIIYDIDAYSGEVLVHKNQSVKKGDILISGNIYNKEDIVNTRCSRGNVYGEVWYNVVVDLPIYYREENVTGKSIKTIGFSFFNIKSKCRYKTYIRKDIDIYNNRLLPIKLSYTEYLETTVYENNFNIINVDSYAYLTASRKLLDKLDDNSKILDKKILKKELKNSRIIVDVFFKVYENISEIQNIDN